MNVITFTGRCTKDIELFYTKAGEAIGKTDFAINEYYTNKTGEKIEDTTYIEVVFYGRTAENANKILRRGDLVAVQGKLKQQNWVSREGKNRNKHYIQCTIFEFISNPKGKSNQTKQTKQTEHANSQNENVYDIPEDEIPF